MTVHLVGAGPGDPELLTLRAARLLASADVVVHDRLVSAEILDMVAPWAECIDVGKDPNGERTSQDDIHDILVDAGTRHDVVVRLKGGDPFVFGRGGEEALALRAHGIAVEAVPGISSSVSGPAAAGIPVTHRGVAAAFTVVTAHRGPTGEPVNWRALAEFGETIVVLMGARRAAEIASDLIGYGLAATTPVAVVHAATTPQQRIDRLTLDQLGAEPVANPAVIVIGNVAAESVLTEIAPTMASATTVPVDQPEPVVATHNHTLTSTIALTAGASS